MFEFLSNPLVFYGGAMIILGLLLWLGLALIAWGSNNAARLAMGDEEYDRLPRNQRPTR
jgi:hypothetical protein